MTDFDSWLTLPHAHKIRTSERITPDSIRRAMMEWDGMKSRYFTLHRYYRGWHRFFDDPGKLKRPPIVANLCHYITETIRGYLVGYAPSYTCNEGDRDAEDILDLYSKQVKSRTETELVKTLSIYGQAFELVYLDNDGVPKSTVFTPKDAFVAYAGDVESDSIFGGVVYITKDENDQPLWRLYLYDREYVSVWTAPGPGGPWTVERPSAPHGFHRVPLIEYRNNDECIGDFETIIGLQDAYNDLLNDRIEDKNAFVQAVLVIYGHILGKTPEEVAKGVERINELRTIQFSDENGKAEYLTHTMDETSVQILQDQIKSDIHKLAMVPDLSDEQFANNASGVAMAYKLFGTDQKVSEKISEYQQGFTRRCKLYDEAMHNATRSPTYEPQADIGAMKIVFKLNAPQDLSYMGTSLVQLVSADIISKRTARDNLLIVTDSEQEAGLIKAEKEEEGGSEQEAFEEDYTHKEETDETSEGPGQ